MHNNSNIVCVWYPSGGFGHFISAALTFHANDFVRPNQTHYQFGHNGNSHSVALTAPKFSADTKDYCFDFALSDKNYVVLVDTGIDNESKTFAEQFPNSKIIKVNYSSDTWPIVAYTFIHKAMDSSMQVELAVDPLAWPDAEDWAKREKYFLFLVEHHYRNMWKADPEYHNLQVDDLLDYNCFCSKLREFGINTTDFADLWDQWFDHNQPYIAPVIFARTVVDAVSNRLSMDLSACQDLWTQAVVNYMIWKKFNFVVPANDFADWFTSTDQIIAALLQHHVSY
jgi:hypothetical protein